MDDDTYDIEFTADEIKKLSEAVDFYVINNNLGNAKGAWDELWAIMLNAVKQTEGE